MSETADSPISRSAYLLDGRRVTVRDLLDAGLLEAGTTLRFKRPRKGKTHYASCVPRNSAVLEVPGG